MVHVFTATFATETNAFSPLRTGEADFRESWFDAGEHPDTPQMFSAQVSVARKGCEERGWTLSEGLCTFAQPGGITRKDVYEKIRDQIFADLEAAGPVDMVILGLHGAMMADGYTDCEGDFLQRLREKVGPNVPIGAVLDPHANLSEAMVEAADILVFYKEYPHSDVFERAQEVWDLLVKTLQGDIKPTMAAAPVGMMTLYFTPQQPMRDFVDAMTAAEQEGRVLSLSLVHAFPWGDVPDYGTHMLAITDNDHESAASIAQEFANKLFALRGQTMAPMKSVDEAVRLMKDQGDGLLVLGDFSDNPGAGCPSDATYLLSAAIEAGVQDAAFAFFYDPFSVSLAKAAGVGAELTLRIGGKLCRHSGEPLDLTVEVMHLAEQAIHDVVVMSFDLGDVVVVRAPGNIDIVLTTNRVQSITPTAFTNFGIDLAQKRAVVVKSMQHFFVGFQSLASRIEYVNTPGAATMALESLPFKRADLRLWPFSEAS